MLGYMPLPKDFKYKDVIKHGRPVHGQLDTFSVKHPSMPLGKRAKIFSPFDALKGFSEAVEAKEELYAERAELSEDECAELDRTLCTLRELVKNSRTAAHERVTVTVRHFVPCRDENSEAFGSRGQYTETTGILNGIDADVRKTLTVDGKRISFSDISDITIIQGGNEDLFSAP